jgi:hypothetical protein
MNSEKKIVSLKWETITNREGFTPFKNLSHAFLPEGIQEEYWDHADWVIKRQKKKQPLHCFSSLLGKPGMHRKNVPG